MDEAPQQDLLAAAWDALARGCGIPDEAAGRLFAGLVAAYREPGRHYHTLDHVAAVLATIRAECAAPFTELELAAWYHDAVYDPRRADNEERSAVRAADDLAPLGPPPASVARVSELILLTRTHEVAPGDAGGGLLLDADLAILGAAPETYAAYARTIRREYAWVADADYCCGRRAVLERFLGRPRLFHGEGLHRRLEAQARVNLTAEIAALATGALFAG